MHVLRKEFFREIKSSRNRFLSLLFIVALGVAFFSGVRSAEPDMHLSADVFYDETNFMDIRVLSTLGVTDGDVEAIRQVSGVKDAEPVCTVEALTSTADEEFVLSVTTLTERISRPHLTEGRLPETADECLMDAHLSDAYSLGDTITLTGDGDTDLSEDLSRDTYTIVGFATNPAYLSFDRGTSSIGNGSCDGLVYLLPECFLADYYTTIYITAEGALEKTAFTDAYQDTVDSLVTALEDISDSRCEVRYQEVIGEANEKVADGEKELADAKAEAETELSDAEKELTDGEQELADAKETLAEKEQELADGKEKLADGEQELADGKEKLASGWEQYYDGKAQWEEQSAAFQASKAAFEEQEALFLEKQAEFNEKDAAITEGFTALEQGEAALSAGETTLKQGEAALADAEEKLAMAEAIYGPLPDQRAELEAQQAVLTQKRAELEAQKSMLAETRQTLEAGREALENARPELEAAAAEIEAYRTQLADGEAQLAEAEATLQTSYQTLCRTQDQLDQAEDELAEARDTILDGETQIEDAKAEIADAEKELADGWQEYYDGKAEADEKIADAEKELADAKAEIADLEYPEWYVLDRETIQSYVEYGMNAERIGSIGKVFPAIFFLVAALVSLTTMTRMVEEERTQIGTLKALGYSQSAIAGKYMMYALSASVLGSVLGVLVGSQVLPQVIIAAYRMLYVTLTKSCSPIQPDYALMSTLIAVLCTSAATWMACRREFRSAPAELMRPAAPKQGKRVFLERITFFWKRLSFTSKSTLRNLIRYKKRFFMTIFGIGGCMGLLMVGFGLRDSIAKIVDNQYKTLFVYQGVLGLDSDLSDEELLAELDSLPEVHETLTSYQVSRDFKHGSTTESAYLFVPENPQHLSDFIKLKSRTEKEAYSLDDDTVIVSEKLAKMLDVQVGDTFQVADGDTKSYEITVGAITENYLHHYVYMTPALYEKLYQETPKYNQMLLAMDELSLEQENKLANRLLNLEDVTSVSYARDLQESVNDMMRSLDLVIWVLIISAGLLAFVVLYNLNNINITERRRELATLKVLGFYDGEVAGYVYRENILLTLLGIIAGIFLGIVLHQYIIQTLEVEMLMFGQTIQPPSYLYSSLLTVLFSLLVNISMFYKLKKIDMIESLKSVE